MGTPTHSYETFRGSDKLKRVANASCRCIMARTLNQRNRRSKVSLAEIDCDSQVNTGAVRTPLRRRQRRQKVGVADSFG